MPALTPPLFAGAGVAVTNETAALSTGPFSSSCVGMKCAPAKMSALAPMRTFCKYLGGRMASSRCAVKRAVERRGGGKQRAVGAAEQASARRRHVAGRKQKFNEFYPQREVVFSRHSK